MQLDRARYSVKFYLERLRSQTAQLETRDYPSNHPGPQKWLALVHGLLDTADSYLRLSQGRTRSLRAREALIRDATDLTSQAYRCLALLRGAGLEDLPYPIVGPLQAWFTELGVTSDTIFRAELLANYELRPVEAIPFKGVRRPSPSPSEAVAQIEWPIWRVTVPAKALGISTHFAIVAHELGHILSADVPWDFTPIAADWAQLKDRVAARIGVSVLDSDSFAFLWKVFFDWFQELSSDAFAFLLTGPAFFFSLGDFFQLNPGGYGLSDTHPAHDLRRRLLYEKLSKGGKASYAGVFSKHTEEKLTDDFNSPLIRRIRDGGTVFAYAQSLTDPSGNRVYEDTQAHVLAELHDFMSRIASLVFDQVESYLQRHAPATVYTVAKYDEDLRQHLKPMLLAIPPIESGVALSERRPTAFSSILNLGWAVLLTKLQDLHVRAEDDPLSAKRLEKLHGLLLKAVELSEARKAWERA